ncbi:MAG TPA: hypothetical protein VK928_02330 [Longimicrobiales bacterium]|nr:hypothetical protein [Longimicrobiales bacterium]
MTDRNNLPDEARDENPGAGEQAGEGVGGIGGTLAGAAVGSAFGPVGTIIGGVAGAVGGWWAGEKAGRAVEDMGEHEDEYRAHHGTLGAREIEYDEARLGYGLGHVAGQNPDYRGRAFSDVEPDLRRGWKHNRDYDSMRPFIQHGYERSTTRTTTRD